MRAAVALGLAALPTLEAFAAELEPPYAARWSIAPDIAFAPYSEVGSRDTSEGVLRAFALGLHGLRRWDAWGAGLALEGTVWRTADGAGEDDWFAALHVGAEGELLSVGGRLRSRLGAGLAVLLEGSALDPPGEAGFYVDLRPAGFRWALGEAVIGLDPLALFVTVPDVGGIPLVDVQFRLCVSVELGT